MLPTVPLSLPTPGALSVYSGTMDQRKRMRLKQYPMKVDRASKFAPGNLEKGFGKVVEKTGVRVTP